MSKYEDPTETLLERSLHNQAVNAPGDDFLLDRVQHRVKARRNTRAVLAGAIACGATIAAVAAFIPSLNDPATPAANGTPLVASEGIPDWRWESYGGIEVQVPATWGYGPGVDYPACLIKSKQQPHVARPGIVPAIACPGPVDLRYRADSLTFGAFGRKAGLQPIDNGWAEESRVVAGTTVTVFSTDAALRERILASAQPIEGTDQQGCAVDHPLTKNPALRPSATGGLASIGAAESISVCRYAVRRDSPIKHPLLASSKLGAEQAAAAVASIVAAPAGTGPDTPGSCMYKYGEEAVVLTVRGDAGTQQVYVRYAGCEHNGFDDGATRWKLTKENVPLVLAMPNRPSSATSAVGELLWPR
ncbi:hypothetical protein [Kribbella deserti]|uniref:Uncharacterized protein n=1 Tax=Kribbella deserti TaxID=1926257 RepID=A0ABV6QFZ8_9ACTN